MSIRNRKLGSWILRVGFIMAAIAFSWGAVSAVQAAKHSHIEVTPNYVLCSTTSRVTLDSNSKQIKPYSAYVDVWLYRLDDAHYGTFCSYYAVATEESGGPSATLYATVYDDSCAAPFINHINTSGSGTVSSPHVGINFGGYKGEAEVKWSGGDVVVDTGCIGS